MPAKQENKSRITLTECLAVMGWYWTMYNKFKKADPSLKDKDIKTLIKEYLDQ